MSDRSRDNVIRHPADERTADQSTQSASGLSGARPGPGPEVVDDVLNRNSEDRYATPRRYEDEDDSGNDAA